ncbi:MAG: hypothetical protein IJX28_05835 [Clostridia bacterium]|nr:hypothetical protein [Clostridia bacterium]
MKLRLLSLLLLCLMLSSCFALLPPLDPPPTDENGNLYPLRTTAPALSEEALTAPRLELRDKWLLFVDETQNQWGTDISQIQSLQASHAADQAFLESDCSQIFSALFSNGPISMYVVSEADINDLEPQTGFFTLLLFGNQEIRDPLLELSLTSNGILIFRSTSGVYYRSREGAVNTRLVHRLLGW